MRRIVLAASALVLLLANAQALAEPAPPFALFPCGFSPETRDFRLTREPCLAQPDAPGGPPEQAIEDTALDAGGEQPDSIDPPLISPAIDERPVRHSWWVDDTKFFDGRSLTLTAASVALVGYLSWDAWWEGSRKYPFHAADEGWFGALTYTGGADKASHFFFAYESTAILGEVYQAMGKPARQSRLVAGAVTLGVGILIEVGDGYRDFGYSWSDLVMNTLGILAAVGLESSGLDDTMGFRIGWVPYEKPENMYSFPLAATYSHEIYTADLKWNGAIRRMGGKPGLARYLLTSVSYSTKGYRPDYFDPSVQERNVGIEIGLNVAEILRVAGVPEESWWGKPLILFATYFRIPYTSIGWYYDLNHDRWNGPHNGAFYDPRL
jgi:hypothetical protein